MKNVDQQESKVIQWFVGFAWFIGLVASVITIFVWLQDDEIEADILKEELQTHMEKNW